jgi:hypothetical protein
MFWTISCTTQGCEAHHSFSYEKGKTLALLHSPFDFHCPQCDQTQTYAKDDLKLGVKGARIVRFPSSFTFYEASARKPVPHQTARASAIESGVYLQQQPASPDENPRTSFPPSGTSS